MHCVVLAGGLGTRMRPLTEAVPKVLLPVAGRPFAEWQLERLIAGGVSRVVYCVGYLGEAVASALGDGRRFGIDIKYAYERGSLLGTAGAIRNAIDAGLVEDSFFVLYGDSYLLVDMRAVERAFVVGGRPALMTVFRNRGQWDTSNAVYRDGSVVLYDKFAADRRAMEFIDYGLLVLTRSVVEESVPSGADADLADVLNALSRQGRLAGYETTERFYEVGSPAGLADLEAYLIHRSR